MHHKPTKPTVLNMADIYELALVATEKELELTDKLHFDEQARSLIREQIGMIRYHIKNGTYDPSVSNDIKKLNDRIAAQVKFNTTPSKIVPKEKAPEHPKHHHHHRKWYHIWCCVPKHHHHVHDEKKPLLSPKTSPRK